MIRTPIAILVLFAAISSPIQAAELTHGMALMVAANTQQDRMKSCNSQAKEQSLTGESRKSFMSTCLSSGSTAKSSAPQERMKTCNKDAGARSLKGDARKQFMSTCLKG